MDSKNAVQHVVALTGCGRSAAKVIVAAAGDDVLSCKNAQEIGNAYAAAQKPEPKDTPAPTPQQKKSSKP